MSAPQIDPQVRRRLDRFIDKKRRQGMPEQTVVQIMLDTLIELINERDGDPDLEADADDEDGGDEHPGQLCGRAHLGPGDATDAECNGDPEPEPIELDLADDERSHNAPVSETTLGEAALLPRPMPPAAWERREGAVVLPEPPEGYVAIRVLPNRLVER